MNIDQLIGTFAVATDTMDFNTWTERMEGAQTEHTNEFGDFLMKPSDGYRGMLMVSSASSINAASEDGCEVHHMRKEDLDAALLFGHALRWTRNSVMDYINTELGRTY